MVLSAVIQHSVCATVDTYTYIYSGQLDQYAALPIWIRLLRKVFTVSLWEQVVQCITRIHCWFNVKGTVRHDSLLLSHSHISIARVIISCADPTCRVVFARRFMTLVMMLRSNLCTFHQALFVWAWWAWFNKIICFCSHCKGAFSLLFLQCASYHTLSQLYLRTCYWFIYCRES